MYKHPCCAKAVNLGLALGIIWGLSMLITGLLASHYDWGHAFVQVMGSVYPGFEASVKGSILGLVWGFIDAFIAGFLVYVLYCWFNKKCCKSACDINDVRGD